MSANYVNIAGGTTYTLTLSAENITQQKNQFRLICQTADGAITIVLPKVSAFGAGVDAKIFIDDTDGMAATNNITVMVDPTDTIANSSSFIMSQDGEKVAIFISSKTEFGVLSNGGTVGGLADGATLLSIGDKEYPLISNPSENIIANGIEKVYSNLVYSNGNNNLKIISFPDLIEMYGTIYIGDDESGVLESLSFEQLTRVDGLFISSNLFLTSLSFPELLTLLPNGDYNEITNNPILETITFPKLNTITGEGSLYIAFNEALTSVSYPLLVDTESGFFQVSDSPALISVSIPNLILGNGILIRDNPLLESVSLNEAIEIDSIILTSNALTEASVDNILATLDEAGVLNGQLDINGGTNATPSAAGLVSKASLEGKGWTVINN